MRLPCSALAALLLVHSTAVLAGTNTWTQIGHDGGAVFSVMYTTSAPGTAIVTSGRAIYRNDR